MLVKELRAVGKFGGREVGPVYIELGPHPWDGGFAIGGPAMRGWVQANHSQKSIDPFLYVKAGDV